MSRPVGRRLAWWIPAPPTTTIGKAAAVAWAAPITLAGLVAGAASLTRPRLGDGVVMFTGARGVTGAVIRRRGFSAAGLGHVVVTLDADPAAALVTHELVHVRQAERLGPLMAPVYLWFLAAYGYRNHPMEHAARVAAARR